MINISLAFSEGQKLENYVYRKFSLTSRILLLRTFEQAQTSVSTSFLQRFQTVARAWPSTFRLRIAQPTPPHLRRARRPGNTHFASFFFFKSDSLELDCEISSSGIDLACGCASTGAKLVAERAKCPTREKPRVCARVVVLPTTRGGRIGLRAKGNTDAVGKPLADSIRHPCLTPPVHGPHICLYL